MDEVGRPVRVIITAGTVNDCTKADELTCGIDHDVLVADRGYDANAIINTALQSESDGPPLQVVVSKVSPYKGLGIISLRLKARFRKQMLLRSP